MREQSPSLSTRGASKVGRAFSGSVYTIQSDDGHTQTLDSAESTTLRREPEPHFDFSALCNEEYERPATYPHSSAVPTPGIDHQTRQTDHAPTVSGAGESSASMSAVPYYTRNIPQPASRVHSKFAPFGGHFEDPKKASAYRKVATRFDRKPYRHPETDGSIREIYMNRRFHVERIYNAMIRGDAARDNSSSIAMKRWVHGTYYDSVLIESYAHKVLDCLLLQANEGFRGWPHNDYVADDRKGEDEDRDVSCAGRLDNIIRALEEEKTICEDVMNSACQIRMFVNAPKAYANRKYQNRVGNSKRGRGKEAGSDIGERPSKERKSNPKSSTRARRATSGHLSSVAALCTSQTPVHQQEEHFTQPRYATPLTQHTASPGAAEYPVLTPVMNHSGSIPAAHPVSFSTHHGNVISPPQHIHHNFRMDSIPQLQHPPYPSPQYTSIDQYPAPLTPDGVVPSNDSIDSWSSLHSHSLPFYSASPADEPLFSQDWDWSTGGQPFAGMSANLFAQHPDAALLSPTQQPARSVADPNFRELWQNQNRVQQLPQHQVSKDQAPKDTK